MAESTEPKIHDRPADAADYTFVVGDLATDVLKVLGFEGTEGLSKLFDFHVELCSDDGNLDLTELIGKHCTLEIRGTHGTRWVHGIARQLERTGEGANLTYYAAEIVPIQWLLTKRFGCRIFQDHNTKAMAIPVIVEQIFINAGIPEENYRYALNPDDYVPREYVVQYRESEMDFISRIMEEEGIFYYFEQTEDGYKMVIGDGSSAHDDNPEECEFAFRDPSGLVADQEKEFIYSVRDRHRIQYGAVCLDDFNFTKPQVQLRANVAADKFTSLEYADFPGRYEEKGLGARLAKIRLEEQQAAARVVRMASAVRALIPGYRFTLIEHPNEGLNNEYLITEIAHRARQPQAAQEEADAAQEFRYDADVLAIPADVAYRPPRVTPRPAVSGAQTAVVVGPKGEEIYTDKYGRVKVQFHWDPDGKYDENSSCWVRASQGAAGGQYGMMFIPRVGQEVIVEFLEGDPDRPIITGRVYNSDHMPPYGLPGDKTKSVIKTNTSKDGGGTNEICFEDLKDNEQILIYAQKDFHLRTGNDRVETIGNERHLTVEKNQFELVKQKKHSEVKLDCNQKVGGKLSLEVAGDHGQEVGGNFSQEAGGKLYIKSGQEVVIEGAIGLTLKVGGNFIKLDPSGVTIQGTLTKINSGGAAGSGTPVALNAPEAAIEADEATPGRDTTYSADPYALRPVAAPEKKDEEEEEEQKETSWVEIEMVDEEGQPWPNELYEITLPDGKVRKGRLNHLGQAHIPLPDPVNTQVSFPKLDSEAWERA